MSVFECKTELATMAEIVCITRSLVHKSTPWKEIDEHILERYGQGEVYDEIESVMMANQMLRSIPAGEFRGYLPDGLAVLFHPEEEWNGYPASVWKWQCVAGSGYRKGE